MKRRQFLRAGCAHCALLAAAAHGQAGTGRFGDEAATAPPEWSPPPRFAAPDPASDEGGLWALMGREEQRLRRSPFLLRDAALRDYVTGILCRLGGAHCADVRVYVIRNAFFNANMAPNGMMQVWSGLLLRMDNEAQLAAVIGHELGHFLQRHSLERLRDARQKSAAGLFLVPFGLVGLAGQLALVASRFAYSRDQEREADAIGVRLMSTGGYDTSQAAVIWSNLLAEVEARPQADPTKSSVLFAAHPPSEERRETLGLLGKAAGDRGESAYAAQLASRRLEFLEDELKRGQFEETFALLDRKLGSDPACADYRYARGEARRLRAQDRDMELAYDDLRAATAAPDVPAPAFRSLGFVLRHRQDKAGAASAFARYLELAPGAPDAAMVETYLGELQT